jgi:hypothetical protein
LYLTPSKILMGLNLVSSDPKHAFLSFDQTFEVCGHYYFALELYIEILNTKNWSL